MVPRPGRELAVTHRAQLPAQRLLRDRDAELLPQPLAEIDQPPAHHAVAGRDRARLDRRGECGAVSVGQPRRRARRLAVDQAFRPRGVEPHHPVTDDLQRHRADPRRLGTRRAVVDRRQRQQTPCLRRIPGSARRRPQRWRLIIRTKGKRLAHGEAPMLAKLNQKHSASGKALRESGPSGPGINSASRGYLRDKSQAAGPVCTQRLICVQEEVRLDANGLWGWRLGE